MRPTGPPGRGWPEWGVDLDRSGLDNRDSTSERRSGSPADRRTPPVQAIAAGWPTDPETLPLLRERATTDQHWAVRQAAVQAIAALVDEEPPAGVEG